MWKIEAKKITQKFNRRKIFDNISFKIKSGESIAITGSNGSGKTTLIRIISQLLRPSSGEITFLEKGNKKKKMISILQLGLLGLISNYITS